MNDKEFKKGRRIYYRKLEEKEYYLNQKKKLEELLKNPDVQEYINTIQFLASNSDKTWDEENFAIEAFDLLAMETQDSKKIYVFLGIYFYPAQDGDEKRALLRDIETEEPIFITLDQFSEFMKNNDIVYIENWKKYTRKELELKMFYIVRNDYLSSLGKLNQEKARERILKR